MILGIMRNAMLSFHREGDAPPEFQGKELDMAISFRVLMAQCVILADYTKPHSNLIECLLLHLQADCMQMREADISVWILVGVITRLAMRMGYHRDPKAFPVLSPFQAEMRRRVWSYLRQADVLLSSHVCLPSMIRWSDGDVEAPGNLYDDDFDEHSKEIPASRPINESTPISYMIAKCRLTLTFGRVVEFVGAQTADYDTLIEIDSELRRNADLVPEHLRICSSENYHPQSSPSIGARVAINSIYHKGQCVLHRRYITRARENPRHAYSRRTCIDSAMELLRFQVMMHNQSQPGGAIYSCGCPFNSNFLLAGTIVCLDVYHTSQLQMAGQPSGDTYAWGVERQDEMLSALQRSRDMWNELRDESIDAWKASSVLGLLLEKMSLMRNAPRAFEPQDEKENAAITLGLLNSGLTPSPGSGSTLLNNDTSPPKGAAHVQSPARNVTTATSPFGNVNGMMPDFELNLDWVCLS